MDTLSAITPAPTENSVTLSADDLQVLVRHTLALAEHTSTDQVVDACAAFDALERYSIAQRQELPVAEAAWATPEQTAVLGLLYKIIELADASGEMGAIKASLPCRNERIEDGFSAIESAYTECFCQD